MSDGLRFLLVDNYDSFTFNLSHLFAARGGVALDVRRNDDDFLGDIARGAYDGVIISPGPGTPEDAAYFGHNAEVITHYGARGLPILGVCLGFQGIYHHFGGALKVGAAPVHGKVSRVNVVADDALFAGVPKRLEVMRYHSIIADLDNPAPACLALTAFVDDGDLHGGGELMALRHKAHPIYGVQFHPESFATEWGGEIASNFIAICRRHRRL